VLKKKILIGAAAVVVIGIAAVAIFFASRKNKMEEAMQANFTVETAKVERQTLANSISATGTVESAQTKTVNTSVKDIEVVAVYVKEGDYVEEGTVICEFDAADYEEALTEAQHNASVNAKIDALNGDYTTTYNEAVADAEEALQEVRDARDDAKDDYKDAVAELEDEENDLAKAKVNYEAIADELNATAAVIKEYQNAYDKAQQDVASAQIDLSLAQAAYNEAAAAGADASSLGELEAAVASAQNALEAAESELESAKSTYTTAKTGYDKLLAVQEKYEEEQSEYAAAEKNVTSTKSAYEQAQSKREAQQDTYEAALEKAKNAYDKAALEAKLITETQEEKTIEQYTELIEDCVVTASMSGVITSLNVTEGNIFEGGNVYTIQDNDYFIVSSTVDEYDIASVEKGMAAHIKTDATGDVEMAGEVTYVAIEPSSTGGAMGAVSSSASYRIEVTITDPDENLRAGMTAKLSIALEESKDALTVPYDAVSTDMAGNSTIKVDVDGEEKTIVVETGLETDYYTEIISDEVEEGMTVYLNTPMVSVSPEGMEEKEAFEGMMPGGMPSGMPSGGGRPSGGGMPSGMPGGGPGGF